LVIIFPSGTNPLPTSQDAAKPAPPVQNDAGTNDYVGNSEQQFSSMLLGDLLSSLLCVVLTAAEDLEVPIKVRRYNNKYFMIALCDVIGTSGNGYTTSSSDSSTSDPDDPTGLHSMVI
jgi:hypothetical protein